MKTKTIKIYEFKELNEDIQKRVLENNRLINVEHEWWESDFDSFQDELSYIGFEFSEIYFSLHGQGGGLSFDSTVNLEKILKYLKYPKREINRAMKLQELDCLQLNIVKTGFWNIYSHELTRTIDNVGDLDVKNMITVFKSDELIEKIEKDVEVLRISLCKRYHKILGETYDDFTSDNSIIDTIEANEYMFDNKGDIQ